MAMVEGRLYRSEGGSAMERNNKNLSSVLNNLVTWKKHWSLCILSQTVLEKEQGGGKAEVHLGQVGVHGEPRHKTIRYEQSCHLEEALVPLYPVPDCAGEGAGGGKGEVHQV